MYAGDVNRAAPHNKKGNIENRAVISVNGAVLSLNGGSWDDPPPVVEWNDELMGRRDAVLALYFGHESFVFKILE